MKKRLLFVALASFLMAGCAGEKEKCEVFLTPAPLSCVQTADRFAWNDQTRISFNPEQIDGEMVKEALYRSVLPLNFTQEVGDNMIILELVSSLPNITSPEGYVLKVSPDKVSVQALSPAGIFYGLQSLKQLTDGTDAVPGVEIADEPRFPYRGVMLDVSRHFRSAGFVKKQIELLSSYKINRLHLHLTDAAGWRLEIDKYPRLTEYAAWRKQNTWKEWWNAKREYCEKDYSGGAYGGYYTKEEVADLLKFAALHQVTVIPEIEMPSHSEEVLAAYPELSCTHQPGASDFCVGNEKTFEFIENVLTEVMEMFPSEYIHIGGDEAGKSAWKTCPLCQKRMKEEGLKNVDELQSYLIHRVETFLNSKGRKLLGWDEILEGGLAPNATVMSWRGEEGGIKAVRAGHHAIMTPGEFCYLDSYQDAPYSQPEAIGGYLPLGKVYSYEPVPDSLNAEERDMMLGVQGNLWAEYIPTDEHMEYMLYPRAIAVAETGWTMPENKSWESFRERILRATPRWKAWGYHPFDITEEIGNRPEYAQPVTHLATGKKVTFNNPYWKNYPANGEKTLTDGLCGGWSYNDKRWLGFSDDSRMDVTIDLEKTTKIHSVSATFMQVCGPWVYFPARVVISGSADGKDYQTLAEIDHNVVKDDAVSFKDFAWEGEADVRYIRYQAIADTTYPGIQFVDEIIVR